MKLELGCGSKKTPGYVGIDIYDWSALYEGDFILGKIPAILSCFTNNSIDRVKASHILEHIPQHNVIRTFNEVYRILAPNRQFDINIPPTTGKGAFADPTHVSFWNELSFRYFDMSWDSKLSKSYGIECNFKPIEIKLLSENNLHVVLQKIADK
jgi:hypothetical protein